MPEEPAPQTEPSFEQALSQLERIVASLERGEPELTAALAKYEKGVLLLTQCHRLLDQAEQSVALLTGVDDAGNPLTAPFDATATITREAGSAAAHQPRRRGESAHETAGLWSSVHAQKPSVSLPTTRSQAPIHRFDRNGSLANSIPYPVWTTRWERRVKYTGKPAHRDFALQSFLGSWVDFRGSNVNNSEAYEVARVWKTDENAFPSRECWAISSSFRKRRVLAGQCTVSRLKRLKRLKHDEFSHDINRGVSAGRVSGRGAAAGRGGLEWLLARG